MIPLRASAKPYTLPVCVSSVLIQRQAQGLRHIFGSAEGRRSGVQSKRVVVTGIGCMTTHGRGKDAFFEALCANKTGIIRRDVGDPELMKRPSYPLWKTVLPACFAQCPYSEAELMEMIHEFYSSKETRLLGQFDKLSILASWDALKDAGWNPMSHREKTMTGLISSSAFGNIRDVQKTTMELLKPDAEFESSFRKFALSRFGVPAVHIALKFGFEAPSYAIQAACAGGAISINSAATVIRRGQAHCMLAGGGDSVSALTVGAFARAGASTTTACKPMDEDRSGMAQGEGAVMLLLEELEHARERGVKIYAELLGSTVFRHGYSMTTPELDGEVETLRALLDESRVKPESIELVIPHLGATPKGDLMELQAIASVLCGKTKPYITATKGSVGHLGGGAAAVDAALACLVLDRGMVPPCVGTDKPIKEAFEAGRPVLKTPVTDSLRVAMTHTLGLGGEEAGLIFGAYIN
eukprot:gb/GEZN01003359.1/.p1 GENE.gb/GEZN01003359.1/~~gb/GEZN01003359.1/.p1  ORF type:complete len:468 (+),score=78.48 gb/GEZN01003359.1/:46-1449(+)